MDYLTFSSDISKARAVVLAAPFAEYDIAMAAAPDAVRVALETLVPDFDPETLVSISDSWPVAWDVATSDNLARDGIRSTVAHAASGYLGAGLPLVVIGGNRLVASGLVEAAAGAYGNFFTVVSLSARLGLAEASRRLTFGNGHADSAFMAVARSPFAWLQFGARSFTKAEWQLVEMTPSWKVWPMPLTEQLLTGSQLAATLRAARRHRIVLTIDADAFDPSVMPDAHRPVPGGLIWTQALSLIRQMGRTKKLAAVAFTGLRATSPDSLSVTTTARLIHAILTTLLGK